MQHNTTHSNASLRAREREKEGERERKKEIVDCRLKALKRQKKKNPISRETDDSTSLSEGREIFFNVEPSCSQ